MVSTCDAITCCTEWCRLVMLLLVAQSGVDGLIVCNTTVSRPSSLKSVAKHETGGLSGAPLKQMATDTVRDMYRLTKGL